MTGRRNTSICSQCEGRGCTPIKMKGFGSDSPLWERARRVHAEAIAAKKRRPDEMGYIFVPCLDCKRTGRRVRKA